MVQKEFTFYGKSIEEIMKMNLKEFSEVAPARIKRSLRRGLTEQQKLLLLKIKKVREGRSKKPIKTHCRDMVVIPEMVGIMIMIHSGKSFENIQITHEMLGHYLGEFAVTRRGVHHSAPGVGATKSSSAVARK